MNKLIVIFGILSIELFFAIASSIGYTYKGLQESKVYVIYCVMVAMLNLGLSLRYIIFINPKLNFKELSFLLFPFFVFLLFLMTGLKDNTLNPLAKTFFGYFLLWSVPAIYAAIYTNKLNLFNSMTKWFEVIMLILSLSIIFSSIVPFIKGTGFVTAGGATYQTASYLSAFAYGLNLYFLIFGDNHIRFNFTKRKAYYFLCIVLLFIQLLGIFLSGGRGGIVLAVVYTVFISLSILKTKKLNKIIKLLIGFVFMSFMVQILLPILQQNAIFAGGFGRIFEFLSSDFKINWEGTSNRDIVYSTAWNLIKQKPILGYGLYGFWDVSGYPHNIVLEILLNGGIIYLMISLFLLLNYTSKLVKLIRFDAQKRLLVIVFLYPLTLLMFSGTYMTESSFWFSLTFVFSYSNVKFKNNN